MSVLARAEITLFHVVDIVGTTRYYILKSSTANAPSIPTTNPPGAFDGWTTTEPSYTTGSTNTLYFVDLTEFTDGSFKYTPVSKSSSYEAAKEAYNKALSVETRVINAETKIAQNEQAITLRATKTEVDTVYSKIDPIKSLVKNGDGSMGDNSNFDALTFDAVERYYSSGSFTSPASTTMLYRHADEKIPIDISKEYMFSVCAKTKNGLSSISSYIDCYDADGKQILGTHAIYRSNTLTTLAQDLNPGDTVVYLSNMTSSWKFVSGSYNRIIFWNYTNSYGYTYPPETYSRNSAVVTNSFDLTNKTVTLSSAWTGATIPAGTQVSQGYTGTNYKTVAMVNVIPPTEWLRYSCSINGSALFAGTETVRIAFLWNINKASDQIWITNVEFYDTSEPTVTQDALNKAANAQATAENATALANDAEARVSVTESLIEVLSESISMLVTDANGASLMTQTSNGWTFSTSDIQTSINRTSEALNDLTNEVGDINGTVTVLQQAVEDLGEIADYVKIGTYGTEPCIELGEADSEFKLRITNTRMIFTEGSTVLAYFNNQSLHIKKAVVEEELRQGSFVWKARSNGNLGLVWVTVSDQIQPVIRQFTIWDSIIDDEAYVNNGVYDLIREEEHTYEYEEGMTWSDFIQSSYNDSRFAISGPVVVFTSDSGFLHAVKTSSGEFPDETSRIEPVSYAIDYTSVF